MTVEGVDYAWDRPSVAGLMTAGKKFVVRYGGPGSSGKQLNATEARSLLAAGLSIVANAEGAANGLLGGRTAGRAWAADADQHFRSLGMPADRPIYLSVDFDAGGSHWPAVDAALRGAAEVLGPSRVGVYGSYDTIAHCVAAGTARWLWQTYAWSGGKWHPRAHLQQYRNGVSLAGGTVDLNRAMVADYGQWGQGDDDMSVEDVTAGLNTAMPYRSAGVRTWAKEAGWADVSQRLLAEYTWVSAVRAEQMMVAVLAAHEGLDHEAILARIDQHAAAAAARADEDARRDAELLDLVRQAETGGATAAEIAALVAANIAARLQS